MSLCGSLPSMPSGAGWQRTGRFQDPGCAWLCQGLVLAPLCTQHASAVCKPVGVRVRVWHWLEVLAERGVEVTVPGSCGIEFLGLSLKGRALL